MIQEIKVSFIIPAYNAEKFIKRCVESILHINRNDIEVIVIDDGSKDDTKKICLNIIDDRLKVISQKNSGISIARNNGIFNSTGQYVCFVDADDEIISSKFEKVISSLKDENDIILYNFVQKSQNGEIIKKVLNENIKNENEETKYNIINNMLDVPLYRNSKTNYFGGKVWQNIYDRNFLLKNSCFFNEQLTYAEDLCFCIHALMACNHIKVIDEYLYVNYIIPGSVSRKSRKNFWNELKNVFFEIKFLTKEDSSNLYYYYGKAAIDHYIYGFGFNECLLYCRDIIKDEKFFQSVLFVNNFEKTTMEKFEDWLYKNKFIVLLVIYKKIRKFFYNLKN